MSVRIESQAEPIPGYKLLDRLGSGGFGEVWRCEAPGGINKAVKIIFGDLRSKNNDLIRYAEQELKALKRVKQVRHPYLLALDRYDIVDGRLMIVMELADCNLWDRFREHRDRGLPGIPRDELMLYMTETAEVLDLMNDQFQLQHLDIKPQNLFLLYNHVKVADFGQVKDLEGVVANVTGGITPVYAAPETFDGIITRFCDQYSLACVYQELLTGQRPFDGTSMSHLLMQHINLPPNLDPSPAGDRAPLARALAKKPEDRWPSVSAFVRALREGSATTPVVSISARLSMPEPRTGPNDSNSSSTVFAPKVTSGDPGSGDTPFPKDFAETSPPVFTPAPPERTGPGPLRPALVIGLGQAGLRVLQRLRFDLAERYGPPEAIPAFRTLFVDTDADAIDEAVRHRPQERLAGLHPDEVVAAKLNRATHYLKPRMTGRSLTEGWFDPQLLYRIPRTPQTMGLRLLGRLAFCDHFRPLMGKVQAELDAALNPDALAATGQRTGLEFRTNRPRVFVVTSLAGGTGGGMFLDVAYAVRTRMKRLGYEVPEVVGVFVVPPADPTLTPAQALGNTYAALTELNHFTRADTVFTAQYDERNGCVREKDSPFSRWYVLQGTAAGLHPSRATPPGSESVAAPKSRTPSRIPPPGSRPGMPGLPSGTVPRPGSREASGVAPRPGAREASGTVPPAGSRVMSGMPAPRPADPLASQAALKPYSDAADLVRLDLFSPVGRVADESRLAKETDGPPARGVRFSAFGLASFEWPRSEVVHRTAARVASAVLLKWTAADPKRARESIPAWASNRWTQLGLDPDAILGHLQNAADLTAGGHIEELITLTTDPLVPKGWLARLPEPERVSVAVDRLVKLLGPPASPAKRQPGDVEIAVAEAAVCAAEGLATDLRALGPALVEDVQFRIAGADDVVRQLLATTDRLLEKSIQSVTDLDAKAVAGFECIAQYAHFQKGMRKPTAVEFTEAVKQYPRARFQSLLTRQVIEVYRTVRAVLAEQLAELSAARQRMEAVAKAIEPTEEPELHGGPRRLMPPGCASVTDAVYRFLGVLTDADLAEVDRRVQAVVEPEGGLYHACAASQTGPEAVAGVVLEEARAYLDARLGDVDLAAMFADRFRSKQLAERAIGQAYSEAEPGWVGPGPWSASEVTVLAAPAGELREFARRSIPVAGLPVADSRDNLTVYREYPCVPLTAVPHLGPAAAAAYQGLPESNQCTPHCRLDVTMWTDVDAE
jgi:serine/threonine protein kinase